MSQELSFQSQPQSSALAQAESSRAMSEVQASLVIAKKFPRDEKAAIDRILNACTRESLANVSVYQYSRGGTDITGPSIRLAEALAQNWGNMQFGIRELEQSNGESTVEAFAWDLETNTRQIKVFQVPHVRHTKAGAKPLTDPRDIYELVANNGARRVRACILGVIPGDVVELALNQCETTMTAQADTSPEAQKKILDAFAKYGVTKDQIEKKIQRRMDAITAAQVVNLRKIMSSLKDGMSQPGEWFDKEPATVAATVPPPAKRSKKQEEPAAEFPLDDPRKSPKEVLKDKMEASGLSWADVKSSLEDNGMSPGRTLDETNDETVNAAIENFQHIQPL